MHPALRQLLALKLRGVLRKRARRLRRPSGWIFALLGAGLFGLWMYALLGPPGRGGPPRLAPDELRLAVRAACLGLTVLTLTGAFSHRGLYLPREEIELLFSAPVSRRDLVRYRLLATVGRATFGALVLALVAVRRLPSPLYGALGVFVAVQTLPLVGQGLAVLLGDAENRMTARLTRLPMRWIQTGLIALVILFFVGLYSSNAFGPLFEGLGLHGLGALLGSRWLSLLTLPFAPWAHAITATAAGQFLPWFGLSVGIWLVLFEVVARLRVDYRELSLATSADVARRLSRRRRSGGGASASEALSRSAGWRVPWLFGRGPGGAVAWRKTCSILRKARGTVLTSILVVGGLTVASLAMDRSQVEVSRSRLELEQRTGVHVSESHDVGQDTPLPPGLPGTLLIAIVGTLYLCAGLRFDFREDLESMETVKAWPVRPWRLFLATILPEVVLVSALLGAAIVLRGVFQGTLGTAMLAVVGGIPITVFLWAGIDNAVFLYMPVRQTPGQEGALHHVGRTMALLLVRMLAMSVLVGGALLAVGLHWLLDAVLAQPPGLAWTVAIALLVGVLAAEVLGVVAVGGVMLRRFDVARDSG